MSLPSFQLYFDGVQMNDLPPEFDAEFSLTLTRRSENGGLSVSYSSDLTFTGDAYTYLRSAISDRLDSVRVQINSLCCDGEYQPVFYGRIDGNSLEFCFGKCEIRTQLIEDTAEARAMECLASQMIADDEFIARATDPVGYGASGIYSPQFTYCNEVRPDLLADFLIITALLLNIIYFSLLPIIAVTSVVITIIGAVIGYDPDEVSSLLDQYRELRERMNIAVIQCGRRHPAPFVRTYANYGCGKCGLSFQSSIFTDPGSAYFNAAYFNAPIKRGLRPDETASYIDDNKPIKSVIQFLDDLKATFNGDYRIEPGGILRFERKDYWNTGSYLFDLTYAEDQDYTTNPILQNYVCYSWDNLDLPAIADFNFTPDPLDSTGNEAAKRYNDTVVWQDVPAKPNIKGSKLYQIPFGTMRGRRDGIDRDVLATYEGWPLVGGFIAGYDYVMLLTQDKAFVPKILIWDETSALWDAKVKHTGSPWISPPGYPYTGRIYNYQMFVESDFNGNLYDNFWFIDDPKLTTYQGLTWKAEITFTCEDYQLLNLNNPVLLPNYFSPGGTMIGYARSINWNVKAGTATIQGIA